MVSFVLLLCMYMRNRKNNWLLVLVFLLLVGMIFIGALVALAGKPGSNPGKIRGEHLAGNVGAKFRQRRRKRSAKSTAIGAKSRDI